MELNVKHDLLCTAVVQLFILAIAWAFYAAARIIDPLPLPDASAMWVYLNPTSTTLVVTVVATAISSITLYCFQRAAKHVLRQYLSSKKSISLAKLGMCVSLASAEFVFKPRIRHLGLMLGALIIAGVFVLVNSAWTTLLTPSQINVLVSMHGEELDLGNPAFDTVLGQDMNDTYIFTHGTLVTQPDSANAIVSVGLTSGITSATAYASGQMGILNFNDISYNVSSGGILPTVMGYGSAQNVTTMPTSRNPAAFGGGAVPANLKASSGLQGISSAYSINQQGLTANVTCSNYTNPADWYPISVETVDVEATYEMDGYVSGILPAVSTTLIRMSCNPNVTGEGMIASMAAVNFNNSNYLGSVVCPYTWQDALSAEKIVVYHSGVGKYASLPPTICTIELLLTESLVVYANQLVTTITQNTTAIPYQHNLNFWVTLFFELEEWGFQTARINSLGNMLLTLLTSGPPSLSEAPVHSYQMFLQEFWRGIVEVLGTSLRSGYTAYPQNVSSITTPMGGVQNITTMGWTFDSRARIYALTFITVTAAMTFMPIILVLYQVHQPDGLETPEEGDVKAAEAGVPRQGDDNACLVVPQGAINAFDASDPIHLIVASASQRLGPASQASRKYWDQYEDAEVSLQMRR